MHGGGVLTTAREYGLMVMVLAALALLGVLRPRRLHALALQAVTRQRATITRAAQRVPASSVPDDQPGPVMMAAGCLCGKRAVQ